MNTKTAQSLLFAAFLSIAPCSTVFAQGDGQGATVNLDRALMDDHQWYFSWGYSRQQYEPSDIHVSQPGLGNDFTVHQASGKDFPATVQQTIDSTLNFDFTVPQENLRFGKFMNPEKTFAIELSIDHSKYNVDQNQTANVTGTINNKPYNGSMVLSPQDFYYVLHNGLNHIMVNGVWLHHLMGPEKQPGDLQLISRAGAGILLPHAENTILGNENQVGPKNKNVCCFASNDWWQVNGWTAGVEVGVRYTIYKSIFLEATSKLAYGALRNVPVYQGKADQTLWMTEQVVSTGFTF
jgi:hypothetical protein